MQRDIAEYRTMCGQTLGVVLATGPEAVYPLNARKGARAESVISRVVNEACWAQVAFVYVVAAPQVGEDVTRLVHLDKRGKNAPLVQVVECDEALLSATREAASLEVIDALFDVSPVDCDSALVMLADHPLVTAEQVFRACSEARQADMPSSRIVGEGLPYFVGRS